mgnify:CR=1 FL=1
MPSARTARTLTRVNARSRASTTPPLGREYQELQQRADFASINAMAQTKLADEIDVSREDEVRGRGRRSG